MTDLVVGRVGWSRRAVQVVTRWLLPAALTIAFGYAGYERRWAGDDGFINLRVVSQMLNGHGFVFNAGERCEAVTSAGWIFFLTALGGLGIELDTAAWVGALTLSMLGLTAAAIGSMHVSAPDDDEPTLVLPLGLMVYPALSVAWDYATSALENGIGMAFLGGTYCGVAFALRPTRYTRTLAYRVVLALVIGIAPMMRPDYVLYVPALLGMLLLACAHWSERFKVVLSTAVVGVGFQIFRMGYFAALVPNTAFAKEAFESRWEQGGLYFANTFSAYKLWMPLSVLAAVLLGTTIVRVRRAEWQRALLPLSFVASGMLNILYVVRVGGDFMHGRLLLPGLFAICCGVGTLRVRADWLRAALALAPFAAVAAWAYYCAANLRPEYFADQILDERRWYSDTAGEPHPTHLHHYSKHHFYVGPMWCKGKIAEGCKSGMAALADDSTETCKRVAWPDYGGGLLSDQPEGALLPMNPRLVGPSVVGIYSLRPIGIVGRLMGTRIDVVDMYGLADPLASRMELAERGRPGHEKALPTAWFAAKYVSEEGTRDERVQLARQALECGPLKVLHEATHEPLSVGRFVRNIGLSFSLHKLRVPLDPAVAVQRFCKTPS